jgi:hypothetical protein
MRVKVSDILGGCDEKPARFRNLGIKQGARKRALDSLFFDANGI